MPGRDSDGAGGEKLGRAGNGDSNGAAAGGNWRGVRIASEPRARTRDRDAALGRVGVRSVDAGERAGGAVDYRARGVLASGAACGECGSLGGAAVRVNHGPRRGPQRRMKMGPRWRSVCAAASATEVDLLWRSQSPLTRIRRGRAEAR